MNNSVAIFQLGCLHENGIHVKKDIQMARKLYEKSAQMNNSNAILCLGFLYEGGIGVKQDHQRAKEKLRNGKKIL